MNILVVDDDPTSRIILQATLKKMGHQVTAAKDGAEALALFEKGDFPLVLSDMVMPVMDGLELCRRIRSAGRPQHTYIILLTTVSGKYGYLVGMRAGADDFISKPFDEELLATRLAAAERFLRLEAEVEQLTRLVPMCFKCRSVRKDRPFWQQVETYLATHANTKSTIGYCPDCLRKLSTETRRVGGTK